MNKALFITSTDTNVGKTIATLVLGALLKFQGLNVGIMKPVQCGGEDAFFLKGSLGIQDDLDEINPYFAKEPLAPSLAFSRARRTISIPKILQIYRNLKQRHDVLLIEGAGGLLVPLKDQYLVSDLIQDMEAETVVVSRLGLGTINHTLLTVRRAQELGIKVKGIIFCDSDGKKKNVPEQTNPAIIQKLSGVPVLGMIPHLKKFDRATILNTCRDAVKIDVLMKDQSPSTISWARKDKEFIWHPFTQMQDWLQGEALVIEEGRGCYLKDTDGKQYLDGVSSLWVNVHGHRRREIDAAIKAQLNRLAHSTFLGLSNVPAIQLAEELIAIAPKGLKKVFYSDNGSTAVEVAIKMAYQYWQNKGEARKTKIAHLQNSYHGDTLGSVSVGGIDLFHKVYGKLIFETIAVEFPDFYRAPEGKRFPEYADECLVRFEQLLKDRSQEMAALIIEPLVQGAGGIIVWPKGLLKKIAKLCQRYNVFLIADEVATGFGRTGTMFACQQEGVTPDFLCLAKGLTGGYLPLAATLTTNKIFEGFLFDYQAQKTFFHGHTYTGNPLACAAALASLRIFKKDKTLAKIQPKIKHLAKNLQKLYNLASVGDIRQQGLMVGIELVKERSTKEPFPWEDRVGIKVCQKARELGVLLRPLGNVIVLMPPLAISLREIDSLLTITYQAIESLPEV